MCHNYGLVSVESSPDPSNCWAMGKGLAKAEVGKDSVAVVHIARTSKVYHAKKQLSLHANLLKSGTEVRVTVERSEESQYNIRTTKTSASCQDWRLTY